MSSPGEDGSGRGSGGGDGGNDSAGDDGGRSFTGGDGGGGAGGTGDRRSLSPSELATYADCPRKHDYDYVQDIETPDETRLYLDQGLAYHATIESVCEETAEDDDPATIHDRAMAAFEEQWAEHVDPDEYASRAHREYQRAENRAAIEAFFDPDGGDGIEHARRSVATEVRLECHHDGLRLHGYADNVLRTEDGLHVFDYKRTLRGIVSEYSVESLEAHLHGDGHHPRRVKSAFQTAAYVEGVKESDLHENGTTVRFSFYGLMNQRTFEPAPDGYEIAVRGYPRETTAIYEEHYDTIWALVERAHDGIAAGDHDPVPFDLLVEEACPDCEFRAACADYLASEVGR